MTNTDTTEIDYAISALDIKAMKEARSLVLFYRPDNTEGTPYGMRVGTEVRLEGNPDAERELLKIARSEAWTRTYASEHNVTYDRTIAADPAFCQTTVYEHDSVDHSAVTAVWVDTMIRYGSPHVRTALQFIKVGDSIGVHFVGSNNSDNTRAVNYHRDECYLRVIRKGKLVGEFLLGVMVGPNNTARMVQT